MSNAIGTVSSFPQNLSHRALRLAAFGLIALVACGELRAGGVTAQVHFSVPSPQPVGTTIKVLFSATDTNTNPGNLNYRLDVAPPGSTTFTTIHDFAIATSFYWAQNLVEGTYQLRITARDNNYISIWSTPLIVNYTVTPIVTGNEYAASATIHPLVALFSAPPCAVGSTFKVQFQAPTDTSPYHTNPIPCTGSTTMNVQVAGMYPTTTYTMNAVITPSGGSPVVGPSVTWKTGKIPSSSIAGEAVKFKVPCLSSNGSSPERLFLFSFDEVYSPIATDMSGNIMWFYQRAGQSGYPLPATVQIDRLLPDSLLTFAGFTGGYTGNGLWGEQTSGYVVQQIDLAGNVIQETNVDRINEQLGPSGLNAPDYITTVNHDMRHISTGPLAGNTILISSTQRSFPAGTQGSTQAVDILGTMLLMLDSNYQVIWYWDAFNHDGGGGQLDITRAAPLGETCTSKDLGTDGCPPVLLPPFTSANDWLHTNTVQYMPDGDLVISMRDQDWIAKIDFQNGTGTGDIVWLMGEGTEGLPDSFTMVDPSNNFYPWFSHQHDGEFQDPNYMVFSALDNGNTRHSLYIKCNLANSCSGTAPTGDSRGYVMSVDTGSMTVTPTLLTDLGYYAPAMGLAQVLQNGNWNFEAGDIAQPTPNTPGSYFQFELSDEVNASTGLTGSVVCAESALSPAYRAWRLTDFYNLPTGFPINP
jgi:hypothetical protein